MARTHHRRGPDVERSALPIIQADHPRLFQLGHYAARASECLLDRIVPNTAAYGGGYNFVFNRAGKLIFVHVTAPDLLNQTDVTLVRMMAMKVTTQWDRK